MGTGCSLFIVETNSHEEKPMRRREVGEEAKKNNCNGFSTKEHEGRPLLL